MIRLLACAATCGFALPIVAAMAAGQMVVIDQIDRMFDRKVVAIGTGDMLRFTNRDEFLHQIYVESAGFSFDSDEQAPGEIIDVTFPRRGEYEVRCGIHPRMSLAVSVE
ncbi:methylamine utilization protein [Aurantimonas sp. A2-1-M11]|uniref:methylamine utilization protein n=1 Tax=Aurantimonas sp. A2-1-M11 TaxID=3113712 RepID=UPI002F953F61